MSDVKLFRLTNGSAEELVGRPVKLEKTLQTLIEKHIEAFLHVRFVASEYSTGKTHAGRIDTLGLDENVCPVIIEYKRDSNANVINQGLFYLDWLMDHKAEFALLVQKIFDPETARKIDWSEPRLLCVARDFTRYDVHAIQQINRNIELLRYARFGQDLLMLDLVNTVVAKPTKDTGGLTETKTDTKVQPKGYVTHAEYIEKASPQLKELFEAVREHMLDMGDDVQERLLKLYTAFKRISNFACVSVIYKKERINITLKVDPSTVALEKGFSRDMRGIGHAGTGDLELAISSLDDLEKAKPLIQRSFEEN